MEKSLISARKEASNVGYNALETRLGRVTTVLVNVRRILTNVGLLAVPQKPNAVKGLVAQKNNSSTASLGVAPLA